MLPKVRRGPCLIKPRSTSLQTLQALGQAAGENIQQEMANMDVSDLDIHDNVMVNGDDGLDRGDDVDYGGWW